MWRSWCRYKPAFDQDYKEIFEVCEDSNNPKNLEICRQHVVFQHFPMQRLIENPGTWSVNTYKYGQLIAHDSNTLDWIYVIKSGEARVFKFLCPNNIDIKARRRKTQALINSQSPFYRKTQLLNFINDRDYIKTAYNPTRYRPAVHSSRVTARSAPPASSRVNRTVPLPPACRSLPGTRQGLKESSHTLPHSQRLADMILPKLILDGDLDGDLDKDATVTETGPGQNDTQQGGPHGHPPHPPHVVIQETVEELPESMTRYATSSPPPSLSADDSRDEGPQPRVGQHDDNKPASVLTWSDGFETDSSERISGPNVDAEHEAGGEKGERAAEKADREVAGDSDRWRPATLRQEDARLLGSELNQSDEGRGAAASQRFLARRLSSDMTGGLFEPAPGPPGQAQSRRRSILLPPDKLALSATAASTTASSQPCPAVAQEGAASRGERRGRTGRFVKTPGSGTARSLSPGGQRVGKGQQQQLIQVGSHTLPAFVLVETLHPGQVFGLRACLDPEERGPSVSLVSGECEVLQINKKFFMRHCDDAIYSLIRLKNKPFPSEEDLFDRMDINMQWEEYKQKTLHDFIQQSRCTRTNR